MGVRSDDAQAPTQGLSHGDEGPHVGLNPGENSFQTHSQLDLVEHAWRDLRARCIASGMEDMELVDRAFAFASRVHVAQVRKSKEPYIIHPLAVARITLELLPGDSVAVAAALLHDVVEDGDNITPELLSREFNPRVSLLVEGLTKISKIEAVSESQQLLNYDKLLKSMEVDLRIVFIKLADRLHNMQTLRWQKPEKQEKIASETMLFYVSLAEWLGLYRIKSELENLAFKYQNPKAYEQVQQSLDRAMPTLNRRLSNFSARIRARLDEAGLRYQFESRIKSNYSIWRKMQKRACTFEEVIDLLAVRVIFTPVPEVPEGVQCWYVYTLLTECYAAEHSRTRNWVSAPKVNGYEALHCTLFVEDGGLVEVQIRTERMHELAEYGAASHRKYKGEAESDSQLIFDRFRRQLGILQANSGEMDTAQQFVEQVQERVLSPQILVYSADGAQAYSVMRGCTVLDFAYYLGEEVGHQALGALVNGALTKLDQVLQPGSRVEILRVKSQCPSRKWLDMVRSTRIRTIVERELQRQDHARMQDGILAARDVFDRLSLPFSEPMLHQELPYFSLKRLPDLYEGLATGRINPRILSYRLHRRHLRACWAKRFSRVLTLLLPLLWPFRLVSRRVQELIAMSSGSVGNSLDAADEGAPRGGDQAQVAQGQALPIVQARCCWALPGDDVLGRVSEDGKCIVAHRKDCHVCMQLLAQHVEQAKPIVWAVESGKSHLTHIYLRGGDRRELLADIFGTISRKLEGNSIYRVRMESNDREFEGVISISVQGAAEAEELVRVIRGVPGTRQVYRITNPNSYAGGL